MEKTNKAKAAQTQRLVEKFFDAHGEEMVKTRIVEMAVYYLSSESHCDQDKLTRLHNASLVFDIQAFFCALHRVQEE